MKKILLTLILVLFLTGCNQELTDYTLSTAPATETTEETSVQVTEPKEYLEYATYPVERPSDNVVGNRWYYDSNNIVLYYDVDLRRTVTPCSQPNCTHTSESCTAYLGKGYEVKYLVVGDTAYALLNDSDDGGPIQLISKNLITGEKKLIWDLTPEDENTIREYIDLSIDGNTAFVAFQQYDLDENWRSQNIVNYAYAVDLTTGEREMLLEASIPSHDYYGLSGSELEIQVCTEEFLLVYEIGEYTTLPMSMEEYLAENPLGDYYAYCEEFEMDWPDAAYYSINRATGERTRICGGAAKIDSSTGPFRDKMMSFAVGDTICIYDGHTGEVTECFTRERVAMQELKDGRIIYNIWSEEEGGIYEYYWYDLTTGETHQFQEGVNTMIFSVHGETADYFWGYYHGSNRFISKQDFYNENYDAAF